GCVSIKSVSNKQIEDVLNTIRRVQQDFDEVVAMVLDNGLVMNRLHGTGVLNYPTARDLQVSGIVARASGIDADPRRDHPYAAYNKMRFKVPVFQDGDVLARLMVRVEEVRESISMIALVLEGLPSGERIHPITTLRPGASAFGLVEGWRGPIWHWVVVGPNGTLL